MFVIIVRHYKGIHSATGSSLTAFYYPLCCIVLRPVILVCFSIWPDTSMFNRNPPALWRCWLFVEWISVLRFRLVVLHRFQLSVAGSTEPVFSQDSFPHVVLPPCYQLPGVCGSNQIISYSSPADLVFRLCFPVVLQWLAVLSHTYHLMMSRQVLLIITREGELAHSLRWLIMVRKLVIGTITPMDNAPIWLLGGIRSANKSAYYFNNTHGEPLAVQLVQSFFCYSLHAPSFSHLLINTFLNESGFFVFSEGLFYPCGQD